MLGDLIVVVDKGIEQLRPGRLCRLFAAAVVDVLERPVFVLQFEVVPVFPAQEDAGIAVLEFKIVKALEYLREGFAFLEVQVRVVRSLCQTIAAVVGADQIPIRVGRRPAGAYRQRGVERPFDFADVETNGMGVAGKRQGNADCQGMRSKTGMFCFYFHAALQMQGRGAAT
ncbi:hypothetical protein D3C77_331240 [compost metagenome]